MKLKTIFALGLLFNAQAVFAVSNEQHAINTFDGFCVQNQDDYSNIAPLATAMGGIEVPEEMLAASPGVRNMGGGGYAFRYEGIVFSVMFVNGGGCTVTSTEIKSQGITQLLEKFYGAELLQELDQGIQTTSFYAVKNSGPNQGAILSLMAPKSGVGMDGAAITIIPKEAAEELLSNPE